MKNIFSRIDHPTSKIKTQAITETSTIIVAKRGRPSKPNMVKKLVKVDAVLYKRLSDRANRKCTTIAALLANAMKYELSLDD